MKFSVTWLREFFEDKLMGLPDQKLCEQLTELGLEVDDYDPTSRIIDIQLTPNRGDCLSLLGIAREVALVNGVSYVMPDGSSSSPPPVKGELEGVLRSQNPPCHARTGSGPFAVHITTPDCPLYHYAIIKELNTNARTPKEILDKLAASGINPNHPVVDILNFVMLELGQPMHAFDAAGLEALCVTKTEMSESVMLLNDKEAMLPADTLVIRHKDSAGTILAMAGIMGAKAHSVRETTREIILESAFFTPAAIRGRARNLGLQTEASYRFERGVDPALGNKALARAIDLILKHVGGKIAVMPMQVGLTGGELAVITLRFARIQKILGTEISIEKIESILKGLQMQGVFDAANQSWKVTPPTFRFDIALEIDLIEEIARVYGYNHLPARLPTLPASPLKMPRDQQSVLDLKKRLQVRGYHEALSYSFTDPTWQRLIDSDSELLALSNPISPQLSVMRRSLWESLFPVFLHNQKRQQTRVRLFETGLRFVRGEQIPTIAGLAWGSASPNNALNLKKPLDFYDLKSDVESLLFPHSVEFRQAMHPALHPGRSAAVYLHDKLIGHLGAFHPRVEQALGVSGLYGFEIDRDALLLKSRCEIKVISKLPRLEFDVAFLVERTLQAAELEEKLFSLIQMFCEKPEIALSDPQITLFDVYQGQGMAETQKSMAFHLSLQTMDTEPPAEQELIKCIKQGVEESSLQAVLRDR